jgi:hypothetical protein
LIICTEWQLFRTANFSYLSEQLTDKVIFDGRNLYDPATVSGHGLTYYAIGRGASVRRGGAAVPAVSAVSAVSTSSSKSAKAAVKKVGALEGAV